MSAAAPSIGDPVAWHDAECGAYRADLEIWLRLAEDTAGRVIDLGAGTGRVALPLVEDGHSVLAVDHEEALLRELTRRASARGLAVGAETRDVREVGPLGPASLIIAPMQLVQLLPDASARGELLSAVAAALAPGGRFAAALLRDELQLGEGRPEPIPDVREHDGWVHSSLATAVTVDAGRVVIERLRQLVSPGGELTEEPSITELQRLSPGALEAEAGAHRMSAADRIVLGETDDHVGSVIVVMELAG